jgi:LPXTG-site transpeptidase (sortase) family protein
MNNKKSSEQLPKTNKTVTNHNIGRVLRIINNCLTIAVISVGLYIVAVPFILPNISLLIKQMTDTTYGVHYNGILAGEVGAQPTHLQPPPAGKRLVIPRMELDEPIIVGDDPKNIHLGVWHRPHTGDPISGGNTVLVGHRFLYYGVKSGVFYSLDMLQKGDRFEVWWDKKEYIYQVTDTSVVDPTASAIENPTDKPTITLYTCTPLWTAKQRLVVKANLIEQTK